MGFACASRSAFDIAQPGSRSLAFSVVFLCSSCCRANCALFLSPAAVRKTRRRTSVVQCTALHCTALHRTAPPVPLADYCDPLHAAPLVDSRASPAPAPSALAALLAGSAKLTWLQAYPLCILSSPPRPNANSYTLSSPCRAALPSGVSNLASPPARFTLSPRRRSLAVLSLTLVGVFPLFRLRPIFGSSHFLPAGWGCDLHSPRRLVLPFHHHPRPRYGRLLPHFRCAHPRMVEEAGICPPSIAPPPSPSRLG